MVPVASVVAIENLGLSGDRHALPDSSRQILLIEKETLDELSLLPGEVKENITTSGIRLMTLKTKDQVQIGEGVILEITKPCAPCNRMEELRPGLLHDIAGKRGMLARVLRGGVIGCGDVIQLLHRPPE